MKQTVDVHPAARTQSQSRASVHVVAYLLLALPIVVFWGCWAYLAVNVPKWDDHALKAYLYYSEQEPTLTGKLYVLFSQHNEHRIVLDRFVTWLDYTLLGKLNYLHLMALGNASLLGLLVIFGMVLARSQPLSTRSLRRSGKNSWVFYLVPVAFLLFNLSSWENAFWGMAALQNFAVVLWVLASIYALSYGPNWLLAFGFGLLATLTSGNGILIWPIGAVVLGLQRRYRPLLYWVIGAAVVLGLYFFGYEKPEGNPPDRGSIGNLLKGWLAFNGAAGEALPVGSPFTICLLLGSLLTAGVVLSALWILFRSLIPYLRVQKPQFRPQVPAPFGYFYVGAVAFLLGTATIVAWSRVGFGLDILITSRYKLYSLVFMALAYLFVVNQFTGRERSIAVTAGLVFSVLIAGLSYLTYADEVLWWRRWLLTNQYNWTYLTNRPVSGIDPTTARWIDNSPAYYDQCLEAIYQPKSSGVFAIDTLYEAGNQFVVKAGSAARSAPQPSVWSPDAGLTLLLQSAKRTYLYGALPSPADNARTAAFRGLFPARDMLVTFPAAEPEPGTYKLLVLSYSPDQKSCSIQPTNRTLVVKPRPIDSSSPGNLKKNW